MRGLQVGQKSLSYFESKAIVTMLFCLRRSLIISVLAHFQDSSPVLKKTYHDFTNEATVV